VTDVPAGGSPLAHPTLNGSPFPPIAQYGFLSDCEVCALVAPSGNVEWMCLPRMDSPSIFAAALDRGARSFRPGSADVTLPAGRRYLPGLYTLSLDREANDFFYFISDLAEQDADLQIMYGIGGERDLTDETLGQMSGYEGARPVRIGNGAWDQRQHDVWGVLLDSVYLHTRARDQVDERRSAGADVTAGLDLHAGPIASEAARTHA
jgi:GH15 family glucan-1,4-alpha-glucosidase